MKIEISTSVKAIECANCLLAQAISELEKKPDIRKAMQLSLTDVKNAKAFRNSLLKSFFKQSKNKINETGSKETTTSGNNIGY